jgi:hypothetical protein
VGSHWSNAERWPWFNTFNDAAWTREALNLLNLMNPLNPLNPSDPAVLWRMTRGRSTAHATIFPGDTQTTITWFFDGVMDRAENYESMDLALARADEIRGVLERDGWQMA